MLLLLHVKNMEEWGIYSLSNFNFGGGYSEAYLDFLSNFNLGEGGYSEAYLDFLSNFILGRGYSEAHLDSLSNLNWRGGILKLTWGGGILYGFSICVTSSIFKYYALFHECLGYYIYLLLFPIIFTLLLIFH